MSASPPPPRNAAMPKTRKRTAPRPAPLPKRRKTLAELRESRRKYQDWVSYDSSQDLNSATKYGYDTHRLRVAVGSRPPPGYTRLEEVALRWALLARARQMDGSTDPKVTERKLRKRFPLVGYID